MTEKRSDYRQRQLQGDVKENVQDMSPDDKTKQLKKRLNFAILIVCLLIFLVLLILFKF